MHQYFQGCATAQVHQMLFFNIPSYINNIINGQNKDNRNYVPLHANNIINGQNKDNSKLGLHNFFTTYQMPRKMMHQNKQTKKGKINGSRSS